MPDRIELRGVHGYGHHGVLAQERREGQEFVVDLDIELDTACAARTDDVTDTVSYAEVAADIVAIIEGEPRNLIETVAGEIVDAVLRDYPRAQAVSVVLHKPQAPLGVPFEDVSVRVRRGRDVPVVIALGANLGDPAASVRAAITELHGIPGLWAVQPSSLFRTASVGGPDQDDYVNAVATARTSLSPVSLLRALQQVEDGFDRTRTVRWGPRTLDLDLIQYGDPAAGTQVRRRDDELALPHPRAHQRAFVLLPWASLDPGATLTIDDAVLPVPEALRRLDVSGVTEMADPS